MANNINWGKIYESTAWGSGVSDNSISWGKSYADLAGGGFTGLLDTYSGAAAAYSLRQLSSTYSGDAIVVRRASDNATQSIGFVNNELDTTSLESFCSGTDGFVTTWYDQSGNGNDVAQTTAGNQPKIVSSGYTILENGKTAVEFSGSLTYLDASSAISDGFTNNSVYYKFEIAQVTITSKGGIFSANAGYRGFFNPPSYDYANFHNPNGLSVISSLNVDRTNQFLFSELFDTSIGSGTYELYGNGSLERTEGSEGTSNLDTPTTLYIGRDPNGGPSGYLNGKIQEIVFYNSDQSTNRTGIETNINDFYTIY